MTVGNKHGFRSLYKVESPAPANLMRQTNREKFINKSKNYGINQEPQTGNFKRDMNCFYMYPND